MTSVLSAWAGSEWAFAFSGLRCSEGVGGRLASLLYGDRSPWAVTGNCPVMAAYRSLWGPTLGSAPAKPALASTLPPPRRRHRRRHRRADDDNAAGNVNDTGAADVAADAGNSPALVLAPACPFRLGRTQPQTLSRSRPSRNRGKTGHYERDCPLPRDQRVLGVWDEEDYHDELENACDDECCDGDNGDGTTGRTITAATTAVECAEDFVELPSNNGVCSFARPSGRLPGTSRTAEPFDCPHFYWFANARTQ